MKKNGMILLGVSCTFLFLKWVLWKINKNNAFWWDANSFQVTVNPPLSTDKLKIEYGFFSIDRKNDSILFENRPHLIVFEGKLKERFENEYGEHDFLVTYDDKYYYSFRHFKFNRRHQHDHFFHCYQKGNQIILKIDFVGLDAIHFEGVMNPISNAKLLRCNSLIDSTKILYNMRELINPN